MPMAGDACLVARLRGAPAITGTRQNGVELVANELFDKSPHLLTQGRLIGSNQSLLPKSWERRSPVGCERSDVVLTLVMAWSPARRFNAG